VTGLLPLLQEFYRDKVATIARHQAAARTVGQYDVNNTYQYIINREETQLTWLADAIRELGGTVDAPALSSGQIAGAGDERGVIDQDIREAQAFVDRWRPRIDQLSNARHRRMLSVIIGETLEQKRFFEQARAGMIDLLGKRTDDVGPRIGRVLSTRWIE
jgi:hypothetical protein